MTDIKPFYITILLQAINNMYDAGCSIAKKKQVSSSGIYCRELRFGLH